MTHSTVGSSHILSAPERSVRRHGTYARVKPIQAGERGGARLFFGRAGGNGRGRTSGIKATYSICTQRSGAEGSACCKKEAARTVQTMDVQNFSAAAAGQATAQASAATAVALRGVDQRMSVPCALVESF